jgi:hypothetical protein
VSGNSDRKVISPAVKRIISGPSAKAAVSVSIGADVGLNKATIGSGGSSGGYPTSASYHSRMAYQNTFTPAAKLQIEWGKPGKTQWQLASQIAFWSPRLGESSHSTDASSEGSRRQYGFGTVVAIGGGLSAPFGKNLTLGADAMGIIKGHNLFEEWRDRPSNTLVWSAGGKWAFGGDASSILNLYATNSMGPTLGSSIIVAPDNELGFGVGFSRVF